MKRDDVHLLFMFLGTAALLVSPALLIIIAIIWFGVWLSEDRN
jgi:hypothetical protein